MMYFSGSRRTVIALVGFLLLVAALIGISATQAHAAQYFVETTGNDAGAGTNQDPWATVQHAINMSSSGDDIFVGMGTFTENIVLKDGVSLYGTGPLTTTLMAFDNTLPVVTATGVGAGTTIASFKLSGGVSAVRCDANSSLSITRNIIGETRQIGPGIPGRGIDCLNSSPSITYNIITGGGDRVTGIYLNRSSPAISYNSINNASDSAIWCYFSSPTVRYNTIAANEAGLGGGGGIFCYFSFPTISDNTITGNLSPQGYGGGIYCLSSSPTIIRNLITGNRAEFFGGGGIACSDSSPVIADNTITTNSANKNAASSYGGAGILCFNSSAPSITNNTITDNELSNGYGAGIMCAGSSPTITGNTIARNAIKPPANTDLGYGGGGIALSNSSPDIIDNEITENEASNYGGGGILCFDGSSPAITSNTIAKNKAANYGGGGIMCFDSSSPVITNNTIVGNQALGAGWGGGGIYSGRNSTPVITNNTIYANKAVGQAGGGVYAEDPANLPTIVNCIIWENLDGSDKVDDLFGVAATYSDISTLGDATGLGNISSAPSFIETEAVAPDVPDFRLQPNSPCIDTATSTVVAAAATDKDGTARPQSSAYDMGAFECVTLTLTYTAGPNGMLSGTSPQVVGRGGSGMPVLAVPAVGHHFVNWSDGSTANPRTDTNVLANINVTANFAVNTFTLTYAAGPNGGVVGASPQTVSYGGSGTAVTANPIAGYRFAAWSDGSTANPRTDGNVTANVNVTANFTLDNGVHPDIYVEIWGSDVVGDGSPGSPYATVPYAMSTAVPGDTIHVGIGTFDGNVVMKNDVSILGLGPNASILRGIVAAPVITASGISANSTVSQLTITGGAGSPGGGIYASNSSLTISDNVITDNDGGGIYCSNASPAILRNTINANTGGGIFCTGSSPTITANAIYGNTSSTYGGGGIMCYSGSSPMIVNNTISGNSAATYGGGGVACYTASAPTLINNTIVGNSALAGGGIYARDAAPKPTITNCIVYSNGDDLFGCSATYSDIGTVADAGGVGNISANPVFFAAGATPPDFHLQPASPCVDAGTSTGAPAVDKDGTARPQGLGHDMGAFESVILTLTYSAGPNGTLMGVHPQAVTYGGSGTPVTAVANTGYHFVTWSDGSGENPRTDTNVTTNINVTATFAPDVFTLTYTAGVGGSIIGPTPQSIAYGASGAPVAAVPLPGYRFVNWTDGSSANPRVDLNIQANLTVTANFALDNGVHPHIYVETWGSDITGTGAPGNPYATVVTAMSSAIPGDTVHVGIGTFLGNVTMRQDVTLIGSGGLSSILKGTDPEAPIILVDDLGTGNTITKIGLSGSKTGILVNNSSPIITQNVIEETSGTVVADVTYGGRGILCVNGAAPTITYNIIDETDGDATGIACIGSSPVINYNTITGCNTSGIILDDSSPNIAFNTLTDNTAARGGGGAIYLWNGSEPLITDNTITGNGTANGYGGGIFCQDAGPGLVINHNTFSGNTASSFGGGAIYLDNSSPDITKNTITGNTGGGYGGGAILCSNGSSPEISENNISTNTSGGYGGGVFCTGGSAPNIVKNTIADNNSEDYGGGGIGCSNASPAITNNIITGNSAANYGGGGILCYDNSSPSITRNAIGDNSSENYDGGGIATYDNSSPSIINNTIYRNTAEGFTGGGIYFGTGTTPVITNNTIYQNVAKNGGGVFSQTASLTPVVRNCIVWDNGDDLAGCTATYSDISNAIVASGPGNMTLPPSFVASDSTSPDVPDFRLNTNSPCIDTGTSVGAPSIDKEGAHRPFGKGFDIGAHEYSGMPVYRFYNAKASVHFYTASAAEKQYVIDNLSDIYHFEGVAYTINTGNPANNKPLYRFYNFSTGVHFYTASETEKDLTIANLSHLFKFEGVAYYVSTKPVTDSTTVWRFYNMKQGVHFYTANTEEKENTIANLSKTYSFEGPGFYLAP